MERKRVARRERESVFARLVGCIARVRTRTASTIGIPTFVLRGDAVVVQQRRERAAPHSRARAAVQLELDALTEHAEGLGIDLNPPPPPEQIQEASSTATGGRSMVNDDTMKLLEDASEQEKQMT